MKISFSVHLGLIVSCVMAQSSLAATTAFVGIETGGAGTSYLVENWSNPGLAKAYDLDGNNAYGSAGYYQIRPVSPYDVGGGVSVSEGVPNGNDLGTTAGAYPTLFSGPSFISSITGYGGSFVNFDGYSVYRGPDGSSFYRQGALSVPVNNGPYGSPGSASSYFGTAITFTLDESASFRLGLAVDSVANGNYAPDWISVYNAGTGSVFSGPLSRNGIPDMAFFDIAGNNGDQFVVGLWQDNNQSVAALSLITFDVTPVPEPSTGLLSILALTAMGISRRWRSVA